MHGLFGGTVCDREQQLCKSCDMEARIVQTTFELFLRDNETSCIFFTMPMATITNLPAKGFRSERRIFLIVSGSERTDSFRVLLTALPILVTLYL